MELTVVGATVNLLARHGANEGSISRAQLTSPSDTSLNCTSARLR